MKKLSLLLLIMLAFSISITAKNANPALKKTVTLANGEKVELRLVGNKFMHYWVADDGRTFIKTNNEYVVTDKQKLFQKGMQQQLKSRKLKKSTNKVNFGEETNYIGDKKGLVIMVNFTDVKFKASNNKARYERILNEKGYTSTEGHKGSVNDYFKAQSNDKFNLTFDVAGPYNLKNKQSYYGGNDANGDDKAAEKMIEEAVEMASKDVNFADYDWNDDKEVDQVFVLFAGQGEADSGEEDTVWPHELGLSGTDIGAKIYNGITVDTYACGNELNYMNQIDGIGTFCHEFSHCLGYPDLYDIEYSGNFGMQNFDIMHNGDYNEEGYVPAGYSAYEKKTAGWIKYVELSDKDTTITNLQPTAKGGDAFVIYNPAHKDEYYIIENRQQEGWDKGIPASGLMIMHVDFDKTIWENNLVNTTVNNKYNDHQRMTIFHADNDDDNKYYTYGEYSKTTTEKDLYPISTNNSLTASSKPAAKLYNTNTDGTKFMRCRILNIVKNTDGTINFDYAAPSSEGGGNPTNPEGAAFYESFDKCEGKGGNDDSFSGTDLAKGNFIADNDGWTADSKYGAKQCAKFGTSSKQGTATTPSFTLENGKKYILSFKVAPWGTDATALTLECTGGTLAETSFNMTANQWTEFTTTITGDGTSTITFKPKKRMFLDEVIVKEETSTGIDNLVNDGTKIIDNNIYNLAGQKVGVDYKGIVIKNGRKYLVK